MVVSPPSLRDRFHTLNSHSSQEAAELAAQGQHATLWQLLGSPFVAFLRAYFWQNQWRQGVAGFVSSLFAAYAVFVRFAKLWELERVKTTTPPRTPQS